MASSPSSSFHSIAAATAAARRRVPVVAGGSNSLIHALHADRFSSWRDDRYYLALRFSCCLLWVDVDEALLAEYLDRRVDDMVGGVMVEELREYFATITPVERAAHAGLGKAIGVPAAQSAAWERDVRGPGLAAIWSLLRDGDNSSTVINGDEAGDGSSPLRMLRHGGVSRLRRSSHVPAMEGARRV